MAQYYKPGNLDYERGYNGDYELDIIEGTFDSGEINELPTVTFKIEIDEEGLWKEIERYGIVTIPVNYNDGEDWFRVWETEADDNYMTLEVTARHIAFDLSNTIAKNYDNDDVMICATGNTNGQGALNKLFNGTKFIPHSDILTNDSVRWERKTILEALLSDDYNSFVNRWGGELHVHKYDVYMYQHIGSDKGVNIEYGVNTDNVNEHIDINNVVTRIIPIGFDGLRLTGKTPWVDSKLINKYPIVHEKVVKFDNVRVADGTENEQDKKDYSIFPTGEDARQELIRLSNLMFEKENIDKPLVNIKVDMIELSNKDEYKEYKSMEQIYKGDTVHLHHSKLDINSESRCISYKWDIVRKEKISNEIGDVAENYFDKVADIVNSLEGSMNDLFNGKINAKRLYGVIDSMKTVLRAQYSVAQKQHVRAMLFEDTDPNSATYGALAIGTKGLEIAGERTPDDSDWDWRTLITSGKVKADYLIGVLTNDDGSFKLDLNGRKTCNFYVDGNPSMTIYGHGIYFYNYNPTEYDPDIGGIGVTLPESDTSRLSQWHTSDSYIAILYEDANNGSVYKYLTFDKYNKMKSNIENSPIKVHTNIGLAGTRLNIYDSNENQCGEISSDSAGNAYIAGFKRDLNFSYANSSTSNTVMAKITSDGFRVYGDKQCVQQTEYYGDVSFSATEDISSLLTWTMRNIEIKEKDKAEDGYYYKVIYIPGLIKSTINVEKDYTVYITKIHTNKDCSLWELDKDKFVVRSEEPCLFSFKLEGDRKGFEYRGLNEQEESGKNFRFNEQNIAAKNFKENGVSLDQ